MKNEKNFYFIFFQKALARIFIWNQRNDKNNYNIIFDLIPYIWILTTKVLFFHLNLVL